MRRTRHRLKAALLELIQERSYERISVEDITERADVGRSTFYSHFDSKEDLLFAGFDEWMLSLADLPAGSDADPGFRFSRPLLEHVKGQRRFFQATFVKGNDLRARQRFVSVLVQLIGKELRRMRPRRGGGSGTAIEAQAHALAGAFLGLVAWWLEDGSKWSLEDVDRVFQQSGAAASRPA